MKPAFPTRRAVQLGLTAVALRPPRHRFSSIPVFFAAWLTDELAPQLLALAAADTVQHVARHRLRSRSTKTGLALAALSAAGLGSLISTAQKARGEVESALTEALGPEYSQRLAHPPSPKDLATPWGQLALPFRTRDPEVVRERNIPYAVGGKRFLLDVFRPAKPVTGAPVLLQIHGGAWTIGTKDQQGQPLMRHLARRGWVCVAINYPLAPANRWPAHVVAAKRALAWIREHIASYGGDPGFVAVTGGSAGGHLAALLALSQNDPALQPGFGEADTSVQACVPHYGVYDIAATSGAEESRYRLESLLARRVFSPDRDPVRFLDDYLAASPLDRVSGDAPPFFVIHGRNDSLVPVGEAREFVQRLRAVSKQPVAYAELAGAQHAFDVFPSIRSAHVVRGVERFLDHTYRTWAAADR
ncbi:alpha/beta hydrolase [Amycolatopsis sp. FDAARGOS 1241]|uniref:alpha/beta hydrolase n=1 Tax=Amycolatopsis sp. FDAARGOS 1241 TaxID=2778070 RepID=UPI00194DD341|nr:alpha/beta hydrolase [Amycolatopsis sp. FDAARGOS 1241]QRP43999.1 alpha/beta hydrolase [Amycolatopsis sp. FDAARGOS 1241]